MKIRYEQTEIGLNNDIVFEHKYVRYNILIIKYFEQLETNHFHTLSRIV